jgi:signal peptidase I
LLVLFSFFLVLAVGLYATNPFGTASLDPRARLFGFLLFTQQSDSNSPAVERGDVVLVFTFAYPGRSIPRGDLVTFYPPSGAEPFLKRVVAVAGDTISIRDGITLLNGEPLNEPYVDPGNKTRLATLVPTTVPEGMIFVMGDNRDASMDSRAFGPVHVSSVIGRVGFVLRRSRLTSWRSRQPDGDPIGSPAQIAVNDPALVERPGRSVRPCS